jgi:hypothetical protein
VPAARRPFIIEGEHLEVDAVADPKFDPAALAANAQQVRALATQARAALRADIADRTSRLGRERDDVAREAYGAEQQVAAANQQVKRELAAAEQFDKEAAALERKASVLERNDKLSATAEGEAEDLREQAADQRALADAARQRSRSAEEAADRLHLDAIAKHEQVDAIEKQLAAEPARRANIEQAVDELEWHAQNADGSIDLARKAIDLDAQAAAAEARGDSLVAAAARQKAAEFRDGIDTTGTVRGFMRPDPKVLELINITLPAGVLDAPGFPPPAAVPTPPPTSQLDAHEEPAGEVAATEAAAADPGSEIITDTSDAPGGHDAGAADVIGDEAVAVDAGNAGDAAQATGEAAVVDDAAAESDAILAHLFGTAEVASADLQPDPFAAIDAPLDPFAAVEDSSASIATAIADEAADTNMGFDDPAGLTDA